MFGLVFDTDISLAELIGNANLAEKMGFEQVWVTDMGFRREVFVALTAIALGTNKIRIGTGVTNPYTRRPALIALSIASIDELSNGRAFLGLSVGGPSSLKPFLIDMWDRPLKTIEESINMTRALWKGEALTFNGEIFRLNNAKLAFKARRNIPIYIAVLGGTRMLKLAGRLADGVSLSPLSPKYVRFAANIVKESAKQAGRNPNEIELIVTTPVQISKKREEAIESVRSFAASRIIDSRYSLRQCELAGINIEDVNLIRESLYKDMNHAVKLLTNEMIDACAIVGTIEDCIAKIKEYKKEGATEVIFETSFHGSNMSTENSHRDIQRLIRLVGEEVISHF